MNLKAKRKEKKITLDKLSELTGIDKGDLSKIENGKSNPTYKTLQTIAKALKIEILPFK